MVYDIWYEMKMVNIFKTNWLNLNDAKTAYSNVKQNVY